MSTSYGETSALLDELKDAVFLAELNRQKVWDARFLDMAKYVAQWSKDPSTKTGAVLTTYDNRVLSIGYNGFPRNVADTPERLNDRETKYALIVHCEMNAVLNAMAPVTGGTLYTWPFGSCTRCAVAMIQAGVERVVFPECPADKLERWGVDMKRAEAVYREAHIQVVSYPTSYGQ